MQEQMKITTNENLMDYLRKIIVSANILQVNYKLLNPTEEISA